MPRSADPSWSFAAATTTTGRSLTNANIGGSRSITLPNPDPAASQVPGPADGGTASNRRRSLVDLVPPSLFDRARAGLAAASGGPNGSVNQYAVCPPGMSQASSEVALMTQPNQPGDALPESRRIAEALTPREWDELVDVIVDRLEDRVLDELARRGRRFTPGVF